MQKNFRRQLGLTMIELMFGLAIAAAVTIGGVIAYNNVQPRVTANNMFAAMQGFMVDVAQYLEQYHTEQPNGLPENVAAGTSEKTWTDTAAIADISYQCTAANTPAGTNCTCGTYPCNVNSPNPNLTRWQNMPSISFSDGGYDEDTTDEWHIPRGQGEATEISWSIIPDGDGAHGAAAEWAVCETGNVAGPADTAVAVSLALDDMAVCQNLSQSIARMDHVNQAFCLDADTTPALTAHTGDTNGGVGLNICFGVR